MTQQRGEYIPSSHITQQQFSGVRIHASDLALSLLVLAQQQQLGEATRDLLARRNLTVNGATQRFGLDRNALTRMVNGVPASLEFTERFARTFREDVNEWRTRAGYPPVTSKYDAAKQLVEYVRELQAAYDGEPQQITMPFLPPDTPEDEVRAAIAEIERNIRRARGLPPEGGCFT